MTQFYKSFTTLKKISFQCWYSISSVRRELNALAGVCLLGHLFSFMCFGLQMILNLLGMKCVIAMVFLGVSGYYIFSDSDPFASLTYKNFFF